MTFHAEDYEAPRRGALSRGWRLLPRALPYVRPYRKMAFSSVAITLVLAVATLAEPWPLAFVVDSVLGDKQPPGWVSGLVGDGIGPLILFAVGATLLLTLATGGLTVVNEFLTTTVDQRMVLDFRSDMFTHAQRLSLTFHDSERTGILMFRINNQAGAIGMIIVGIPELVLSLLTIIGMAYVAFLIDHVLALLALAVVPLIFYSTSFYANRIEPTLYRVRGLEAKNLAIVHEAMQMMRVVLAFGRDKHEFRKFRKQGEAAVDARVRLTVRQTMFQLAVQFTTAVGTAAVLGVGAWRVRHGHLSTGELLVVLAYVAQVYKPLEMMTNTLTAFQQNFINLNHALDLMDTQPEVIERDDARAIGRSRGELRFEGVSFGYRSRPDVLRDVSFSVPAGGAVAIVGPTGAGKSTMVSLLPRFYDAQAGRITLDGTDVRDVTLESLRAQISLVLQEPLLFSETIADNILYGRLDATRDEIEQAAREANAHEFITALPDGYDTVLGERGSKVSGGERQRIAIARAFLRDSPILILDEPTSSIDSRTEAVILDALERLMRGRTTILIAHRLSTLRGVDNVVVLNHGRVEQQGSYRQLANSPGLFRELCLAQGQAVAERDGDDELAAVR